MTDLEPAVSPGSDSVVSQPTQLPLNSRRLMGSPVILVRKKNGSHHFCVDYRQLNSVMKPDRFPLPRIDDLLDQLAESNLRPCLYLLANLCAPKVKGKDCIYHATRIV